MTSILNYENRNIKQLRQDINNNGFALLEAPALKSDWFDNLNKEIGQQMSESWDKPKQGMDAERVQRANLGPVAQQLLTDNETLDFMFEVFGEEFEPSFAATCYTYYDDKDYYLGKHLDRESSCTVTLIVYLVCSWPENTLPSSGLSLEVFGQNASEGAAPTVIPTRSNSIVLGRGSRFPHQRPKLQQGERLYALTACFKPIELEDLATTEQDQDEIIETGFTLWEEGEFDQALEIFQQVVALDETSDRIWSGLGHCYWSLGEFDQALEAFTQATNIDGYNPGHWSNIGLCLRDLKQYDRAINAFKIAVKLNPDYAPAINEWGNVLQDQGYFHEALQFYYRSLALDPGRAVVHHNLGVVYNQLDQTELAFDAFKKALDRDPDYYHSLEEIAILYMQNDLLEEAEEMLAKITTPRSELLKEELNEKRKIRYTKEADTEFDMAT